ncbi:N-acetylmuramoyl-L-alanine amidase [Ornithinibacillus sp. 179-J 7C1 HS]|uniref:N-acetylmuramoyl-L-alanine amidase n=1 Tax=Ornithinibacillus sp. 179-J 7C1 HS TaxID=3142384 RepID=UPI00399F1F84
MRKLLHILCITGLLLIVFSFVSASSTHAEVLENNHDKLFEVQTDSVIMRVAPDEQSEIVGELVEGNRLRTFDEKDGWVKTFYKGLPVWVYSEELLLIEETRKQDNKESEHKKENQVEEADKQLEEVKLEDDKFKNNKPEHAVETKDYLPMGYIQPKEVQISVDSITLRKNQLNGYNIMIDAGHGGKDSGAIKNGALEKNITMSTANKLAKRLEDEGANVQLTREDDTFISLENRVYQSNTHGTDVFISLHYDYFSDSNVNGINTYYYNEDTSKELSENIHTALVDELDMTDRGIKNEAYYVLKHNQNSAVLLELGFMSNSSDLEKIQTEEYQREVAEAITNGLVEYFDDEPDE